MNFKRNLYDLISDAHLFQYVDINQINGKKNKGSVLEGEVSKVKPVLFFTKSQWGVIAISLFISFFIKNGFSENFAGYIISGLSLFVGLFFTFLITLYDKFKSIDFSQYKAAINVEQNKIGIRLKNFFKRISVMALYSVVICIIAILLLSITLLFPEINLKIEIIDVFENIKVADTLFTIKSVLIFLYRVVVLYFLFDFVLITIFLTSAFYDFLISEFDKVKLS